MQLSNHIHASVCSEGVAVMSDLAAELEKVIKSIRAKYLLAKRGRLEHEQKLEEMFRPVTQRIEAVATLPPVSPDTIVDESVDAEPPPPPPPPKRKRYSTGVRPYLESYSPKTNDIVYGVVKRNKRWFLGDKEIEFLPDENVRLGDITLRASSGLYDLLFTEQPPLYSTKALGQYKRLLKASNAHYKANDPASGQYKTTDHPKYGIIRGLFPTVEKRTTGSGYMIEDGRHPSYKYWDDVNELVERLRLLHASQQAGNYSHTNEIASIVEELREGGYIE